MKKIFAVLFFLLIFASNAFPEGQLLCDPGFEDSTPNGTFPDSGCWHPCTSGGQAGAVCTTTAACCGNNGLWEYTGEFMTGWWSGPYQEMPANPGEGYYGYCSIRTPNGEGWLDGSKALVRVCFLSAQSPPGRCNDNIIACYESPALITEKTPWDKYEVITAPAPVGTEYVQLMLYLEKPQGTSGQSIVNFDCCYLGGGIDPIPDIKANGSDGPVHLAPNDNLSVTVGLNPGSHPSENADWWVVADTTLLGWYYYNVSADSWIPDFSVTYQGPLFDLSPFEVLNITGLPVGTYTFYFGVDTNMNGSLDYDQLYHDSVDVNIE